jgi:hypothetical protein
MKKALIYQHHYHTEEELYVTVEEFGWIIYKQWRLIDISLSISLLLTYQRRIYAG